MLPKLETWKWEEREKKANKSSVINGISTFLSVLMWMTWILGLSKQQSLQLCFFLPGPTHKEEKKMGKRERKKEIDELAVVCDPQIHKNIWQEGGRKLMLGYPS